MYDKHVGVPEAGSWLESLFFVVWSKRQEQVSAKSWLETISGTATDADKDRIKSIMDARDAHLKTLYPFHTDEKEDVTADEEHEALEAFAKTKAKIDLRHVMREVIKQRKAVMARTSGLPRVGKR